jgi:hypothetical protein
MSVAPHHPHNWHQNSAIHIASPRLVFDGNGRFESFRDEGAHRSLLGRYAKNRLNRCVIVPRKSGQKERKRGKDEPDIACLDQ